jgi:hypothetical protein
MADKKTPKTMAQRAKDRRDKKRNAGLIKLELWIKPEWKLKIQEFVEKLKGEK